MSIQQTHEELIKEVWQMSYKLILVLGGIHIIQRNNWKTLYSFQTLTLPYFTNL